MTATMSVISRKWHMTALLMSDVRSHVTQITIKQAYSHAITPRAILKVTEFTNVDQQRRSVC